MKTGATRRHAECLKRTLTTTIRRGDHERQRRWPMMKMVMRGKVVVKPPCPADELDGIGPSIGQWVHQPPPHTAAAAAVTSRIA